MLCQWGLQPLGPWGLFVRFACPGEGTRRASAAFSPNLLADFEIFARHLDTGEFGTGPGVSLVGQARAKGRVVQQLDDGMAQPFGISDRDEQTGFVVLYDLRESSSRGGSNRHPGQVGVENNGAQMN
jgi:hypothetical protein